MLSERLNLDQMHFLILKMQDKYLRIAWIQKQQRKHSFKSNKALDVFINYLNGILNSICKN